MLTNDQINTAVSLSAAPNVETVSYIGHGQLELLKALVESSTARIQVFDYSDQWRVGNTLAEDDEIRNAERPKRPDWFKERVFFSAEGIAPGDLLIDETFRLRSPRESGRDLLLRRQARIVFIPGKTFQTEQYPEHYDWTATAEGMVGRVNTGHPLLRDIEAARNRRE
ncbi:MAG: hypothetical protein ING66_10340 [Rhodocyclaceae bacterium]|nr:hypothetical protein [Rhodocyclaceae bacterium]MCA3061119.1 hypothetical protein [Rhodocyclaceae bacterium]MCA3084617.1 hypothetical protein [Rhodocyclaceae bacterium]